MRVMTVVGTRPELIKLSCVIQELDRSVEHTLVHTGQNYAYELQQIFFEDMGIRQPNVFLDAAGPTAAETIANVIRKTDHLISTTSPDAFLIYGDTNSCLSVLAAKRRQVPVFHMEAGNRCFDARVPEEINRKVVDHLSDINMVISEHARRYLINEGIRADSIIKVGSSMPEVLRAQAEKIDRSQVLARLGLSPNAYLVASIHREENVDNSDKFVDILDALKQLGEVNAYPVVMSTHPRTRQRMEAGGWNQFLDKVRFINPLSFSDYIALQKNAKCVISDSGTIAEEASLLGLPAVTIRDSHERPEGMDEGTVVMSAPNSASILAAVALVMAQQERFTNAPTTVPDYLGGDVSRKVVRIIMSYTPWVNRTTWSRFV